MTRFEIEHMWKVASNDPNHDYNWNDTVVIAFAKLVEQHEREKFCAVLRQLHDSYSLASDSNAIKAALEAKDEPVAWMVYTQEGKSAFVTDNPAVIHPSQRALPL
jgi:hypothetical protein